jgi:hypothetical protein
MVDDEHLLVRHDCDHRRSRNPAHATAARPHLQQRGFVRIVVDQDPLDRATAAA